MMSIQRYLAGLMWHSPVLVSTLLLTTFHHYSIGKMHYKCCVAFGCGVGGGVIIILLLYLIILNHCYFVSEIVCIVVNHSIFFLSTFLCLIRLQNRSL